MLKTGIIISEFPYLPSTEKESGFRIMRLLVVNWEIRQVINEGDGHGFKERIKDEGTKFILLCGTVSSESG